MQVYKQKLKTTKDSLKTSLHPLKSLHSEDRLKIHISSTTINEINVHTKIVFNNMWLRLFIFLLKLMLWEIINVICFLNLYKNVDGAVALRECKNRKQTNVM